MAIRAIKAGDRWPPRNEGTDRLARRGDAVPLIYDPQPAEALLARHQAVTYPYVCTFGTARLEIDKGVFCPTLTKASPLLLESIDFHPGERTLDVFAGSGAFGIVAALNGATVVAVDIDPLAVACAGNNAALNGVADKVDVRQGTMSESVQRGEVFDLVVANPPLLPGDRTGPLANAIFDPGLRATLAFIDVLRRHLAPGGRCYLLTSDVIERYGYDVEWLFILNRLAAKVIDERNVGYETYRVHKVTHAC